MQDVRILTGHALGFISVALFFYSYQCTEKRKLLVLQTVATALSCVQYFLIGAESGFALNIVCILRNFVFYFRDKKQSTGLFAPISMTVCIIVASIFSWEDYYSLLIIAGLAFNTMCMGICNAKTFRKTILVSSTLIFIYDIFAHSYSGLIGEAISLISATIGIIRYRNTEKSAGASEAAAD